jgi:hypothetical protein
VTRRAHGHCEFPDCHRAQDPLDPHHAFGRGHLPGIPAEVCETRELILGICRPCHDAIHNGDERKLKLARLQALNQFMVRHQLDDPRMRHLSPAELPWIDLVDVMRELVRVYGERLEVPE